MPRRFVAAALVVAAAWAGCTSSTDEASPSTTSDAGDDHSAESDAPATVNDAAAEDERAIDTRVDAESPPSPECAAYCTGILQTCTPAGVSQYPSLSACHYVCRLFPAGKEGDWVDYPDTLSCRRVHLAAAAPPREHDHCHHAGPFGYGGCGGNCGAFCRVALERCKDAPRPPFASNETCMSECANWPYAPPDPVYGIAPYQANSPATGDSIDCREVMLMKTLESASARDTYCPTLATNSSICK